MTAFSPVSSQTISSNSTDYFEFDEQQYDLSYRGIRKYMHDRAIYDKDIYREMLPAFNTIKSKRLASYAIFGTGVALGLELFVMAQVEYKHTDESAYKRAVLSGIGLTIISIIVPSIMMPGRRQFVDFISKQNRTFKDRSIKLGMTLGTLGAPGLGLTLQF